MSRLRHELNDRTAVSRRPYRLLRQAVGAGQALRHLGAGPDAGQGRKRGIERFLLTVNSDNVLSICVIEGNGGVLEDERPHPETGRPFRRYWIG